MNTRDLQHVCFKDLEGYFKKKDYFGDLNQDEVNIIKENLGIGDQSSKVFYGTYEDILHLKENGFLRLGSYYVITDFLSIYLSGDRILGLDFHPSEVYNILLTPKSTNSFFPEVTILNEGYESTTVTYDINPTIYEEISDKGRITFMKDGDGNSAYYDFKNILFYKDPLTVSLFMTGYDGDGYFFTFNGVSKNNTLGPRCSNIIFFNSAINNTFEYNCNNIDFFGGAINNRFESGTNIVIFTKEVKNCKGLIYDATISQITNLDNSKEFVQIGDSYAIRYFDTETQTHQYYYL